jgi:hypothetical protein
MYTASVIHLPHIDHLLSSRSRNLVGQLLVRESFPRCLDDVHLVARAGRLCSEILQAGRAGELEDEMLCAETEAYDNKLATSYPHASKG